MQHHQERPSHGWLSEAGAGFGDYSGEAVERRARELAVIAGRQGGRPTENDREDARRELRGETEAARDEAAGEATELSRSHDPSEAVISTGKESPSRVEPDDDATADRLAREGVDEAQHELMFAARREAAKAGGGSAQSG